MLLIEETTEKIISSFYTVYNTLGYGFLEKVYENSLISGLNSQGLTSIGQYPIDVFYNETKVGQYFADILVNKQIIIEVKAAEMIAKEHELQLINYLKATNF